MNTVYDNISMNRPPTRPPSKYLAYRIYVYYCTYYYIMYIHITKPNSNCDIGINYLFNYYYYEVTKVLISVKYEYVN